MLLNSCFSLNIFNAKKLVKDHVKKSITSSFFNVIKFCLVFSRGTIQNKSVEFQIKMLNGC